MSEFSTLLVSEQDGIAKIVVNRPDKLNALNRTVLTELAAAVQAVSRSGGPRVAVLTGAGDRAFVAGGDIADDVEVRRLQSGPPLSRHGFRRHEGFAGDNEQGDCEDAREGGHHGGGY